MKLPRKTPVWFSQDRITFTKAYFLEEYDNPPAVKIAMRGLGWHVKPTEIYTKAQVYYIQNQTIIDAWNASTETVVAVFAKTRTESATTIRRTLKMARKHGVQIRTVEASNGR